MFCSPREEPKEVAVVLSNFHNILPKKRQQRDTLRANPGRKHFRQNDFTSECSSYTGIVAGQLIFHYSAFVSIFFYLKTNICHKSETNFICTGRRVDRWVHTVYTVNMYVFGHTHTVYLYMYMCTVYRDRYMFYCCFFFCICQTAAITETNCSFFLPTCLLAVDA